MGFQSEYLIYILQNDLFCLTNNEMMYYLDKELDKGSKSMNGDLITLLLNCIGNNEKNLPQYRFINKSEKKNLPKNRYIFCK